MMPGNLRKLFVERLTEPIHLNLLSLFVALFGSHRAKVDFDLIVRQQYAFPILFAADSARKHGLGAVTIIELGVGSDRASSTCARLLKEPGRQPASNSGWLALTAEKACLPP